MPASGSISSQCPLAGGIVHAFTVDVEDYYAIAMRDVFGVQRPATEAVLRNTTRILTLLAEHATKATFFVLGEVAQAFPSLVRDIASAGHEIGAHGFYHRQFFKVSPAELRSELASAKKLLEDVSGQAVRGHRAPAFSIGPDTAWGLEVLAELGFAYDSSVFPFRGRRYGWPGFGPDIRRVDLPNGATIVEAPLSTVTILGRPLPACGGGFLRHLPLGYTRWAIRRIQRRRPAIVYMHPYEIDLEPGPADFQAALRTASGRLRRLHWMQLRNRCSVWGKLQRLLGEFRFAPLDEVIQGLERPRNSVNS